MLMFSKGLPSFLIPFCQKEKGKGKKKGKKSAAFDALLL